MGTWLIYKKHFLQLILTKKKKKNSFDKISPRDFIFFSFFSICTCSVFVVADSAKFAYLNLSTRVLKFKYVPNFKYVLRYAVGLDLVTSVGTKPISAFLPGRDEMTLNIGQLYAW